MPHAGGDGAALHVPKPLSGDALSCSSCAGAETDLIRSVWQTARQLEQTNSLAEGKSPKRSCLGVTNGFNHNHFVSQQKFT